MWVKGEKPIASLGSYFGNHAGDMAIWVAPFRVGKGRFQTFTDFQAAFTGSYAFLGQHGTLAITVKLTDEKPEQSTGPCQLTLNDKTDDAAKYSIVGQKIVLTTKLNATPVDIYKNQGGTQIDNISNHNVWIGPA